MEETSVTYENRLLWLQEDISNQIVVLVISIIAFGANTKKEVVTNIRTIEEPGEKGKNFDICIGD